MNTSKTKSNKETPFTLKKDVLFQSKRKKSISDTLLEYAGSPVTLLPVLIVTLCLLGQLAFHGLAYSKKKLGIHKKLSKHDYETIRSKIEGFRFGVLQVKNFYSENKNRLIELGKEGYEEMEKDYPELLSLYKDYYGIKTQSEYIEFLKINIENGINLIDSQGILTSLKGIKRIPKLSISFFLIMGMFMAGYARVGTSKSHFVVRIRSSRTNSYKIESTTVHEAEHFMQNALGGNYGKKANNGEALGWYCSPVNYMIYKKMSKCFVQTSLKIKAKTEDETSPFFHLKQGTKTIKDIYKQLLDPGMQKYFSSSHEIMARVREVKNFLGIKQGEFNTSHIRKLDGSGFDPWIKLKENLANTNTYKDFINFMNEVP